MRSNNKARISGLAASTHALRSNFTRSPFHLAVGDLGSRLSNNCDTVLDVEIREPISDHNIITLIQSKRNSVLIKGNPLKRSFIILTKLAGQA